MSQDFCCKELRKVSQIYIGDIIKESLENTNALLDIKQFLCIERIENQKDEDPSVWNICRYNISEDLLLEFLPVLSENIKESWYAHFVDADEKRLFVIMRNRYFDLPFDKEQWGEMLKYGDQVGVERRWTESIPLDMGSGE